MDRIRCLKRRPLLAAALGLVLINSSLVRADDPGEQDSRALSALEQMGSYLRSLTSYRLSASSNTDQTLETGQTVEFHHQTELAVVQPNKLQLSVENQGSKRDLTYNGKTFTLYESRTGYFASGDAPENIDLLLDRLHDHYDIQLPLVDLFRWNTDTAKDVGISSALYIGTDVLAGETCTHYAYRQPDIDWQLWIRQGSKPLPCRLVITRRDDADHPRHSVSFHWDLNKPIGAKTFEFLPPAGARKVPLVELQPRSPSAPVQGAKP
jgi:hypothetical protein